MNRLPSAHPLARQAKIVVLATGAAHSGAHRPQHAQEPPLLAIVEIRHQYRVAIVDKSGRDAAEFLGVFIVLTGVAMMLDQLGVGRVHYYVTRFWPTVVIAIGLAILLQRDSSGVIAWLIRRIRSRLNPWVTLRIDANG